MADLQAWLPKVRPRGWIGGQTTRTPIRSSGLRYPASGQCNRPDHGDRCNFHVVREGLMPARNSAGRLYEHVAFDVRQLDAVLLNTAVAKVGDPVARAAAPCKSMQGAARHAAPTCPSRAHGRPLNSSHRLGSILGRSSSQSFFRAVVHAHHGYNVRRFFNIDSQGTSVPSTVRCHIRCRVEMTPSNRLWCARCRTWLHML